MIESYKITNNKGKFIILNDHYLSISSFGSMGSSNIEYQMYTGYLQDGGNVTGYRLDDKQLNLTLSSIEFKDRQTYIAEREALYKFFSPVCSPFSFEVTYKNGGKRTLSHLYLQNVLPNEYQPNIFLINDTFSFISKQPYWLGTEKTLSVSETTDTQLVFPITFPIVFGTSGKHYTGTYTYQGSYKAYPKITLTGAYSTVQINLVNKGIAIYMEQAIASSSVRIINLQPNNRYIIDGSGNNKASDIGLNSNLANFYIEPYDNIEIEAIFYGYSPETNLAITLQETYLGL